MSEVKTRDGTVEEFEWRPIETAPRDGTRVLAWCKKWCAPLTVEFAHIWVVQGFELQHQPTHWMPLPKEPSMTAEGAEQ